MIERHIDYLQFSAIISEQICIQNKFIEIPAPRFYRRGYLDEHGYRLYFGNPNSTKALIVASGQCLENMRSQGWEDWQIAELALKNDGTVTRLDLAVTEWNTFTGMFTVGDVEKWYKLGLIESGLSEDGAKAISTIETGENSVETLYIGDMRKRGKKGIFRAYDKGIELNLGAYMATRIELEERGENSHNSTKRLAGGFTFSQVFRSRFDVKHQDFESLMEAPAMEITRGKGKVKTEANEKMQARWEWLIKQVAPSLKEAYEYDKAHGLGEWNMQRFSAAAGIRWLG